MALPIRWRRSTQPTDGAGGIGRAHISLRNHAIYVQSYSRNPDGLYLINGWLRVFADDTDDTDVGKAVLEALHNTKDNVKRLSAGRQEAISALLRAAGARSYRQYMTGTRSIGITMNSQPPSITFVPYRNGGPTGPDRGFHPLQELKSSLPTSSTDADIGRTVRIALAAAI